MSSREVIKELLKHGWFEVAQVGSHKQFKHVSKAGRVTVPHPKRDIPVGTLKRSRRELSCRNNGTSGRVPWNILRICIRTRTLILE